MRPRTLPLALSSIVLGGFLAAEWGRFSLPITLLCLLTAIFLQILSNLANDYGDSVHGADRPERAGPQRAVQSGAISKQEMKVAMLVVAVLAGIAGILLLWVAFKATNPRLFWLFIGLGGVAILAAIGYTAGYKPYGYAGLGDIAVLIFFGWVGVLGTFFLQTQQLPWQVWLPATACGLMAVAVLNVNNMRDIQSDEIAGKNSIPVRIGLNKAKIYHTSLLFIALSVAFAYALFNWHSFWQLLFLLSVPIIGQTGWQISQATSNNLDPMLKKTVIGTLLFVLTFGLGQIL